MEKLVKVLFKASGEDTLDESMWAEPVGEGLYRLCNVPYTANGYAEGDVVRCIEADGWQVVNGISADSGNGTLRLMFQDSEGPEAKEILNELSSVGCTFERASVMLVAVTVPPSLDIPFSQLANYLNTRALQYFSVGK